MSARSFGLRFSACFAFLMIGAGVQLPFLPLWLQTKGLSEREIVDVLALTALLLVVAVLRGRPFGATTPAKGLSP
jgi:MFS transporter, PPP family, 3-phenylpropionic acid transporter